MKNREKLIALEGALNHFSLDERKRALKEIAIGFSEVLEAQEDQYGINLHAHTFFSYNALNYSPSGLAWAAKKRGLAYIGMVDFDVVDGVDEFLEACEMLEIKGVAGIESRVFIPSYKSNEINSPGEPGIAYHMGTGVTSSNLPEGSQDAFNVLRTKSSERNQEIIQKLNSYLSPLVLDYEVDVIPLTPSGNVSERHIVQKLVEKSFLEHINPAAFWQEKLSLDPSEIGLLMEDQIKLKNTIRNKLIKRGGVAYARPDPHNFPTIDDFNKIIKKAGAIPCMAWLDGTSEGEKDIEKLLGLMLESGVGALNIIPDRNWNISDAALKYSKLEALYKIVALADEWHIPVLIGTEMNSDGQKFVDDLDVPDLAPLQDSFNNGAAFIYGHTRLERLWGLGYESAWAQNNLPDRKQKNSFYTEVGRVITPGFIDKNNRDEISNGLSPQNILQVISDWRESNEYI